MCLTYYLLKFSYKLFNIAVMLLSFWRHIGIVMFDILTVWTDNGRFTLLI